MSYPPNYQTHQFPVATPEDSDVIRIERGPDSFQATVAGIKGGGGTGPTGPTGPTGATGATASITSATIGAAIGALPDGGIVYIEDGVAETDAGLRWVDEILLIGDVDDAFFSDPEIGGESYLVGGDGVDTFGSYAMLSANNGEAYSSYGSCGGTQASPTPTPSTTRIASHYFFGRAETKYVYPALMSIFADQNFTDSTAKVSMRFGVAMEGETDPSVNQMVLSSTGMLTLLYSLVIQAHAAPADGDLAAGDMAIWFDQTNGAGKLMIKAKTANGTVVTGNVALT